MTFDEAKRKSDRLNKHTTMSATPIRILPESLDPIKPGDNGWDVLVRDYAEEVIPTTGLLLSIFDHQE